VPVHPWQGSSRCRRHGRAHNQCMAASSNSMKQQLPLEGAHICINSSEHWAVRDLNSQPRRSSPGDIDTFTGCTCTSFLEPSPGSSMLSAHVAVHLASRMLQSEPQAMIGFVAFSRPCTGQAARTRNEFYVQYYTFKRQIGWSQSAPTCLAR
jgi:hypothetical protein